MNKDQLAALTDCCTEGDNPCCDDGLTEEQRPSIEHCGHVRPIGSPLCYQCILALTALADARLEVARLTEERDLTIRIATVENELRREAEAACVEGNKVLDRQRVDIRRLMEAFGPKVSCRECTALIRNGHYPDCQWGLLLAEME